MTSNLPPHSTEMEQCALGCLLQATPHELIDYADYLEPFDFYELRHRTLFEAIRSICESGKPFDLNVLLQTLKDSGDWDKVGGGGYVASLPDKVPCAASFHRYAPFVKSKAILRRMAQSLQNGLSEIFDHEGDIEPLIDRIEADVMAVRQQGAGGDFDMTTSLGRVVNQLEAQAHGTKDGLATGFTKLDHVTALRPGEMIVLAARPSQGKTAMAMQIAAHNCEAGIGVGFISLEMSTEALLKRFVGMQARVNVMHRKDWLPADQKRSVTALGRIKSWPLRIDDRAALTVGQIRAQARRWVSRHGIGLLIIDYLQLVGSQGRDRREAVDAISRGLKALAKELSIPVLVLAQLNRDIEKDSGRAPRLSDLRESGQIEQDSDVVLMLWSNVAEEDVGISKRNVSLDITKQRNGETGRYGFTFERTYTLFTQGHAKVDE